MSFAKKENPPPKNAYFRKNNSETCGHPSDFICFYFRYACFSSVRHFLVYFLLLLYPTCQCYELWVISLGKVCSAAGSWWAAIKCSNWAFNHADILTALKLPWECASESLTVGLWLDHQDAIPVQSEAEWDEAVNRCWWGEINEPVLPRDSSGPPDDTGATKTMFLQRDIFMMVCFDDGETPTILLRRNTAWIQSRNAGVKKCRSPSQQPQARIHPGLVKGNVPFNGEANVQAPDKKDRSEEKMVILCQLFGQTKVVVFLIWSKNCILLSIPASSYSYFLLFVLFPPTLLEHKQAMLIIHRDGKSLQFMRPISLHAERRSYIIDGRTDFIGYRRWKLLSTFWNRSFNREQTDLCVSETWQCACFF